MVAPVDPAVHHEVVQLGVIQDRPVVGGNQQRHMVDADAAAALFPDIGLDQFLVDIFGDGVLGVIPFGHNIGNRRHNGRDIFYAGTVWTHGMFLASFNFRFHYTGYIS